MMTKTPTDSFVFVYLKIHLRRQRQENCEFKASLDYTMSYSYIVRTCLIPSPLNSLI
jgi:hypothetical protein